MINLISNKLFILCYFLVIFVGCSSKLKNELVSRDEPLCLQNCPQMIPSKNRTHIEISNQTREPYLIIEKSSVDLLSLQNLNQQIDHREKYIENLLTPSVDPYFGNNDKPDTCLTHFKKSKIVINLKNVEIIKYQLTANENLQYGLCIENEEPYNSELVLIYCNKNNKLFQIKSFWLKTFEKNWNLKYENICNNF